MAGYFGDQKSHMDLIRPHLYLSGIDAAADVELCQENGITHLLTLVHDIDPDYFTTNAKQKTVEIWDVETANLLEVLEESLEFIRSSLDSGGTVLVHCVAGVSRSASVVIAHLMRTEKLNVYQAYDAVKKARCVINPNSGFEDQLRAFEVMGNKVNKQHPAYKLCVLRQATGTYGKVIPTVEDGAVEWLATSDRADPGDTVYRCKKCRSLLFTSNHIVTHSSCPSRNPFGRGSWTVGECQVAPGAGNGAQDEGSNGSSDKCRSMIFTVALDWMEPVLKDQAAEGKLSCAKCQSRIGSFCWSGSQCPCGQWVTPSFSFPASRLDTCVPAGQVLAGARHSVPPPRGGVVPSSLPAERAAVATESNEMQTSDSTLQNADV